MEFCVQFLFAVSQKGIYRAAKAAKKIKTLEHFSYKERLRNLGLFRLEKRLLCREHNKAL